MTTRNAELMEPHVGKTIDRIEDTDCGNWWDPDGFIIHFTDGTCCEVSADMGQGVGFVLVDEQE